MNDSIDKRIKEALKELESLGIDKRYFGVLKAVFSSMYHKGKLDNSKEMLDILNKK